MKYIKKYNESREEITSDEGREFLNIVRKKLPNDINKYMSLIGNKGLDVAKKEFDINDPDEIKRKEKERIRTEKANILKNKKNNKLTELDFDILIDKYLKTEDWKEWIKNTGYPDIGNYPTGFTFKINLKKEEYEIRYDLYGDVISSFSLQIVKNDIITIESKYIIKIDSFDNILFYTKYKKTYTDLSLEESIISFLETYKKENIYEMDAITISDIKKIKEFGEVLKNEKYISTLERSEISDITRVLRRSTISNSNSEFIFLYKIPLSRFYYDNEYIYLEILGDYIFKFHEQYASKVFKIYKKLKES